MIDKSKTYTSDGLPVEIYRTDAGGSHPVHGAVLISGCWDIRSWQADGASSAYSSFNRLIEVKKKRTLDVLVNVYDEGCGNLVIGGWYTTKADAERCAVRQRFACAHFVKEITEGEGL